jgi:trk system potassium uptake protein TrkA
VENETVKTKRFICLGLGTFGSAFAKRLCQHGFKVTGVDRSESTLITLRDHLFEAVIGDVTDRATLDELMLPNSDGVVISLGDNIERSILCALYAKELGAPRVFVKGVSNDHAKILRALGVERVIFPEVEMANEFADSLMWSNVLKLLQIDSDHAIVELAVPGSLVGKTLAEADLRRRYNVLVIAILDELTHSIDAAPSGDFRLLDNHALLVMGKMADLAKFRDLS